MLFQKIARPLSTICLLTVITAGSAFADSSAVNSDMMLSGPSSAAPLRLTIKHPKNTTMHVTIVTDAAAGGAVEFNAPESGSSSIAYDFPKDAARNVQVYDGLGQEVWSLIGGVGAIPTAANADGPGALLTELDRDYSIKSADLKGFQVLTIRNGSEFVSTTDLARIDAAGTRRRWAHRRSDLTPPAPDSAAGETTIVITPTTYVPTLSDSRTPAQ